ncbi:MAG: hypothetical protein LBL07_10485 [Tannerella sp.]|jgi:hypothetical protein|nr:hypothetical protein [Tannerella sp.]
MKTKLRSVTEGGEMELCAEQCSFWEEEMKMSGTYHPSVQGSRYGYISFGAPQCGYYSQITESSFRQLNRLAGKSDTTVCVDMANDEIRFYARSH